MIFMRVAIITGASSGIGRAFARLADGMGFDELWLVARREERLRILSEALTTPSRSFLLDLTRRESLDGLQTLLRREAPTVGLLVNSAGAGKFGVFPAQTEQEIDGMIALNVTAVVSLCRIALPYMPRGAHILNMGSASGALPLPGFNVYAATKAFVRSFTVALHEEL